MAFVCARLVKTMRVARGSLWEVSGLSPMRLFFSRMSSRLERRNGVSCARVLFPERVITMVAQDKR